MPRNLGIYTPLRQHSQRGENNVQLEDIHMIYMEKENGKTYKGKPVGSWVGVSGGWAYVPTKDQ
jgi:hypothetical protein